ncbi:MAG: HyaD/HybD family hydrogenase maturation endopeptidase [Desulfobacter sp.]|nr:MAG: HyaD/HybD family hydrogenase maturation endopeptidase [Desulfobacter sp.]
MKNNITILGVGNTLYSDDGVGIRVVERLNEEYEFPDNVLVVDGGVLGINLLGIISNAGRLIVVDTVLNHGQPGDLHRLDHDEIPNRILAKNSLHQVDLIEALTLCHALDHVPQTTIVGIEPKNLAILSEELTPEIASKMDALIQKTLDTLVECGGTFTIK